MPFAPIVYHDEVFRPGADSFAVLMPTLLSLVDATFQDAMAVVEISKAAVRGRLINVAATTSNRVDHVTVLSPMIECLEGPG